LDLELVLALVSHSLGQCDPSFLPHTFAAAKVGDWSIAGLPRRTEYSEVGSKDTTDCRAGHVGRDPAPAPAPAPASGSGSFALFLSLLLVVVVVGATVLPRRPRSL